jgi:hypothetical protein
MLTAGTSGFVGHRLCPVLAGGALLAILDAIEADLRRPGFRGCPFNNASIEFDDPQHPARVQARAYREQLLGTLSWLAVQLARGDGGPGAGGGAGDGECLGAQLAVLIDGAYTSAAHLGPDGAAAGLGLGRHLVQQARAGHERQLRARSDRRPGAVAGLARRKPWHQSRHLAGHLEESQRPALARLRRHRR